MASGPITAWQIEREKVEEVTDFLFLGFKTLWMVTAAMKLQDDHFLKIFPPLWASLPFPHPNFIIFLN